MFGKKIYLIALVITCCSLCACKNANESNQDKYITPEAISPNVSKSIDAVFEPEVESKITIENPTSDNDKNASKSIEEVDYSNCFDGIEGGAVFFNSHSNVYNIYNEELYNQPSSPCSTFKIISTLMGLEEGIISSADSKMGYDGTIYPVATWNTDIILKDAFKESSIWYFSKIINYIGPSKVQKYLNRLKYGNCDISEWKGREVNTFPELNGFWLESSLQISPKEQVDVLTDIFEGKTEFSEQNIELLKEIMLVQSNEDTHVYGKTGSGRNAKTGKSDNGWFVGMVEETDEVYYFAIRLIDEKGEVSGLKAKEIALNIINEYYIAN